MMDKKTKYNVMRSVALLVLLLGSVASAAQDVAFSERHVFKLKAGTYAMSEKAEVEVRYLTPRSSSWTEFGVFEQHFSPIKNLRAELNGRRLGREAIQKVYPESADVFLSSGVYHQINLEDTPDPNDVIRYSYEREYLSPAYAPILAVPDIDRLLEYVVEVEHPDNVNVDFQVYAPRGEVEYTSLRTRTGHRLTFSNLKPLDDLPLFAHNGVHAWVMIDARTPEAALTPTDPQEFAAWYSDLVQAKAPAPTILPVAEGLRGATDSATVASFHDYVRSSIRYIADERDAGAFVPRAPDLVLERTYGDCKDRAFLISAMAQSLGLRVDPVLITTEFQPEFDRAHLFLYNHVICAFEGEDGSRTYFDPTNPYLAFGDLPESDVDGQALRIGTDGAERLFVPSTDQAPTLDIALDLDLDAPEASGAMVTVRGDLLGLVRGVEARRSADDASNALSAVAGDLLYKIRLSRIHIEEEGPRHRTYRANADLSQFVVASPTKRYLPLTPFRAVAPEAIDREEDSLPIHMDSRANVRLSIAVGDTWIPDAEDRTMGDLSGPAWFTARAASAETGSVIDYAFGQRSRRLIGSDRDAYLGLAREYLDARRDVITFRAPAPEAESTKDASGTQ